MVSSLLIPRRSRDMNARPSLSALLPDVRLAKKLGIAVKAYIAFSRACESLTVVELNG